jgi:hypothetical protein
MSPIIQAGEICQVEWGDGNWMFVDLGFSNNKPSCGLLHGDGDPRCVRFSQIQGEIREQVSKSKSPLNLVVEAPLSVCFDQAGNPKRRKIEKEGRKVRYWYCGAGCAVMVSAMYLVWAIHRTHSGALIRLFEGFISFKSAGSKSTHERDVILLRNAVKQPQNRTGLIIGADGLKESHSDQLASAFAVLGLDIGIPAVIKPRNSELRA